MCSQETDNFKRKILEDRKKLILNGIEKVEDYNWNIRQKSDLDKLGNFIYSIFDYEELERKIDETIKKENLESVFRQYTINRWYNYATSLIIESIFAENREQLREIYKNKIIHIKISKIYIPPINYLYSWSGVEHMDGTLTNGVGNGTPKEEQGMIQHKEDKKFENEMMELIDTLTVKIRVLGCGGGGCNTTTRTMEEGIYGAELIGLNTDAMHLLKKTKADKRILIGRNCTRGLGAGGIPQMGETAARETENEIRQTISGSHIVFITCGLGGGTGTGSSHVVAKIAKDLNTLTIAVVTLPFKGEGAVRMQNALWGLERLKSITDTVIVIPNDKLLELVPRMSLVDAFRYADTILMKSIKSITEMLTKPGLVNVDFADLRTIMKSGGVAMIGMGESEAEGRAKKAIEQALSSPLLDVDITNAQGALINVCGGPDMTVEEAQTVVSEVHKKVNPTATIIWGATIDPALERRIKVMLVVTGVNSEQIFGRIQNAHSIDSNKFGLEIVH